MRGRVPDEATCAICGRHFDPSETRGWCPNPSCGEWQHPSFPLEAGSAETEPTDQGSSGADEGMKTCPSCGNGVRVEANFCKHCAHPFDGKEDEPSTESGTAGAVGSAASDEGGDFLECPDCGADLSDVPADRLSRCPICMFELGPNFGEQKPESETAPGARPEQESGPERAALADCPNCGEDLTPIPPEMRTVCPGCRTDLKQEQAPTDADGDAGTAVETVDAIEPGFEARLKDAGVETVGDLIGTDPDELSAKTGISARRIRGWIESASEESGESSRMEASGTAAGAADDTDDDPVNVEETVIQPSRKELVFEVMGREISVTDGQTVGAEVRSAMVEAGAPEQDAVYVHRKHVRVDAEGGKFFLTRLGENSLKVNDRPVEKGNRVPLEDGDQVTFSNVVTATVSVR